MRTRPPEDQAVLDQLLQAAGADGELVLMLGQLYSVAYRDGIWHDPDADDDYQNPFWEI